MGLKSANAADFDHGGLQGLSDDDHTQYVLRSILTTDGDLFSRSASAVTRIAAVATGQVLASAGTGTLPAWSASPTLTSLTCPTLDGGTAANDDITIQGTTHSTRTSSYVLLQPNGGNIGGGITDPGYELDLGGGTTVSQRIQLRRGSDDSTQHMRIGWDRIESVRSNTVLASAQTDFSLNQVGSDGTRTNLYIGSSGSVGIATSDPVISGTGKLHMAADTFRLATARTPASAGAAGNAGEICGDANYIYRCVATNSWARVGIASW